MSVGCSSTTQGAKAPEPPVVEVVQVEQKDVPIYSEWIGTLDGLVNADIKAQVSGYLLKQDYTEGSFVQKGQLLFEIDPRPFQAVVDQGEGQLAQANGQLAQAKAQLTQAEAQLAVMEANQVRTQLDVDRYAPLAKQQAITQQDMDNATQNNVAAKAQVQAAKAQIETARAQIQGANAAVQAVTATVETAKLNLELHAADVADRRHRRHGAATGGRAGQPGRRTCNDGFDGGSHQGLFHRQRTGVSRFPPALLDAGDVWTRRRKGLVLELILADGTVYPQKGSFYFADREVSQGTGTIRVAGLFPNPGKSAASRTVWPRAHLHCEPRMARC